MRDANSSVKMPSALVAAWAQFQTLLMSGKVWMLLAACCGSVLLLESSRIHNTGLLKGYLPQDYPGGVFPVPTDPPVLERLIAFLMVIGAAWALLVWREESWGRREYHSSLPVNRAAHDLWRVAAGAVVLIACAALCIPVSALVEAIMPSYGAEFVHASESASVVESAMYYLNVVLPSLLTYLAVSIFPLLFRRPVEWLVALAAGMGLFSAVAQLSHRPNVLAFLMFGEFSVGRVMAGGMHTSSTWSSAALPWLGLVGLWFAAICGLLILATRRRG